MQETGKLLKQISGFTAIIKQAIQGLFTVGTSVIRPGFRQADHLVITRVTKRCRDTKEKVDSKTGIETSWRASASQYSGDVPIILRHKL